MPSCEVTSYSSQLMDNTLPAYQTLTLSDNTVWTISGENETGPDHGIGHTVQKSFVEFYGMSSNTANIKHFGGLKEYRSSEGRTVRLPYKGAIKDTVQDILGGIRSACTYAGARKLKDLSKCTTFIRVNNQYNKIFEGK